MTVRAILATWIALVATLASAGVAVAVPGGSGGDGPPLIPGARQVHIRNASGGLGVFTSIPNGSAFRSHGGGAAAECSAIVLGDDPNTLGLIEEQFLARSTKWIFIEGVFDYDVLPPYLDLVGVSGPSLADTVRTFSVYCAETSYDGNFQGLIQVPATDPMLDPRPQLTNLYNGLQLEPLAVYENKVVGEWGGLVVRNPAWLAINGSAWRTQRSNAVYYRGWELYLITRPVELDFLVEFVPDPRRRSRV